MSWNQAACWFVIRIHGFMLEEFHGYEMIRRQVDRVEIEVQRRHANECAFIRRMYSVRLYRTRIIEMNVILIWKNHAENKSARFTHIEPLPRYFF